jgi:hypothetical protein
LRAKSLTDSAAVQFAPECREYLRSSSQERTLISDLEIQALPMMSAVNSVGNGDWMKFDVRHGSLN